MRYIMLFIVIINSYLSLAQSAEIKRISILPDVNQYGQYGLFINVSFNVNGLYKQNGCVVAYFYDINKNKRYTYSTNYKATDNHMCCRADFRPGYENAAYNDFSLFIPMDVLTNGLPKNQDLWFNYFKIYIYQSYSNTYTQLAESDFQAIEIAKCGNDYVCVLEYDDTYEYTYKMVNMGYREELDFENENLINEIYKSKPKTLTVMFNFSGVVGGYCKFIEGNNTWIRYVDKEAFKQDADFYKIFLSKDKNADRFIIIDFGGKAYEHVLLLNNKIYILYVQDDWDDERDIFGISKNIVIKIKERL